ncbi:hypothetical protein Q7P35_002211 [Cladosporium inversicolor]
MDREHVVSTSFEEAIQYYKVYVGTGELCHLDLTVQCARKGLELTGQCHAQLEILGFLADILSLRFEQSGETKDLEEVIDVAQQAVQAMPFDHPDRAGFLNNLGVWLSSRYERTGEMKDLGEAIDVARQAIQATPLDHPGRAGRSSNLSNSLGSRYQRTGEMNDLEEAIDVARQAVQATPLNHPDRAGFSNNLGNRLESRYQRTGEVNDLEEAIDVARQAVQATPLGHPDRAMYLNNLGSSLGSWYERTGKMKDLEEAIDIARQAIQATTLGHPDQVMYLNNLGNSIGSRYQRTGEMNDLEEAIDVARQAVQATPLDHPDRAGLSNNLGNRLESRYERTGEVKCLEEAINTVRQAIQATPLDHPDHPRFLNNLGMWLSSRYERTGEMKDLGEAIDVARQAIQATPLDHPGRAGRSSNLSNSLGSRYQRTGEMNDLEEAIDVARQAVQATPLNHPNRAACLDTLATLLGSRQKRAGEMTDLEEGIDVSRQAVRETPLNHPYRAGFLNNLGTLLDCQYKRTLEMKDLDEAIDVARQAVQATPLDHPSRAGFLNNLGDRLWDRYDRIRELKDLKEASQRFLGAFGCAMAVPLERVKAAARCLNILADLDKIHEGIKLGKDALALLPLVHTRNLDRSDQEFVVSGFAGIASDLCALLLSDGQSHEAVECLEQGRAIIISRSLDDRSDISILSQKHPKLAQHYRSLVTEINSSFHGGKDDASMNMKLFRRHEATKELEGCLRVIRALPGHGRFLLGQTVTEMQKGMSEGYVVIVNISTIGSDAIVMAQDSLQAIPLPGLIVTDVKRWLSTDWIVTRRSEQRQKNDKFLEYLGWLWHVCVKDTLHHVSCLYRGQNQALPRVWWIGCGLASSMPFHAAGVHAHGCMENALSRVTSSYTPSVKALGHSCNQIKHSWSNQTLRDHMLITLMPTTPQGSNDRERFCPLEGVSREKENILKIVSSHVRTTVSTSPDATTVLSQLENCRMAHFACHGVSNQTDPSSSGLVLQRLASDGTPEQDHLSVSRISHLRLKHAQIAYLSACSTAENKDARLRDEVIHVVSGFQVAGFPHVIGSLWPAGDNECVEVTRGFYTSLFEHEGLPESGARQVAGALREAVMAVRAEDMDMPLNWAQFVHFGA